MIKKSEASKAARQLPSWRESHRGRRGRDTARRPAGAGLPTSAEAVTPFWGRSYCTLNEAVARLLSEEVTDPVLRALPPVGAVEQWVCCTDVLMHGEWKARLRDVF